MMYRCNVYGATSPTKRISYNGFRGQYTYSARSRRLMRSGTYHASSLD